MDAYRHKLAELKERFTARQSALVVQFKVSDQLLNSDAMVGRWLNAFEYHRDEDKRIAIEELHGVLPAEACEMIFFCVLQEKGLAIMELSWIVEDLIRTPANASAPLG